MSRLPIEPANAWIQGLAPPQGDVARSGKAEAAGLVINELAELHFTILDELFETKILPHADVRHALSSAVGSHAALDVNLKLFELVGRLALRGLWLVWQLAPPYGPVVLGSEHLQTLPATISNTTKATVERIDGLCKRLTQIVSNTARCFRRSAIGKQLILVSPSRFSHAAQALIVRSTNGPMSWRTGVSSRSMCMATTR